MGVEEPSQGYVNAGSGKGNQPSALGFAYWLLPVLVGVVVGVLVGAAIHIGLHHLFDVLGDGSLPSQDHSFQWAAACGGLAAAIAVAAILFAVQPRHHES